MIGVGKHIDSETAGFERHGNATQCITTIPEGMSDCIMEQRVGFPIDDAYARGTSSRD